MNSRYHFISKGKVVARVADKPIYEIVEYIEDVVNKVKKELQVVNQANAMWSELRELTSSMNHWHWYKKEKKIEVREKMLRLEQAAQRLEGKCNDSKTD